MIRVLHVIGKMDRAGAETMIMNLYRNMNRDEIQFDFMVFTDQKGDYDDEIVSLGGNIYHMPAFKGLNYISLAKKIDLFFQEHKYPVVHGHIGSLAPMYLSIAKKHGAYTVAHSHATNSSNLVNRLVFGFLASPVRNVADYFFGCSQQAGIDRFGKKIACSNRFEIFNNAIDCSLYQYSEERHRLQKHDFGLDNRTVYGHVGRFVPEKNHIFLIDIFSHIAEKDENAVLVMAGRGPEEDKVKDYVSSLQLEEKVVFLGIRDDIPDVMNLFDAFIFPSMFEGLGIVAVEAQAAGLPCFVSDGVPEEAFLTDHIWKIALHDSSSDWAYYIMKTMNTFVRNDSIDSVVKAGYDIKCTAKELSDFYMDHLK